MSLAAELADLIAGSDLPAEDLVAMLKAIAAALEDTGKPPVCRIVPFIPGRRPTDEIDHPGLGSSDSAMVVLDDPARPNTAMVLFDVDGLPADATVEATVCLEGGMDDGSRTPLPGWTGRQLDLGDVSKAGRHRLDLSPATDLAGQELGFATGFLRRAHVAVRALRSGQVLAADETRLDVCDIGNLGRLYQRVIERVVAPDTARQAAAAHVTNPGVEYHPWFPVLHIGGDKAALYTSALVEDIVDKRRHLTDPAWLLRVGIYLELLTCIGIAEAVKDDIGDLLDADERIAFETSQVYEEIRARIDPAEWRRVWGLRSIAFPKLGTPRTGPVSVTNLLAKRKATLAFLHVHHEDLKAAIELAGSNRRNSQETWQRVFRDAERAVLRQTSSAFPELSYLPDSMRQFVLWQQRSLADQQGLYATACIQYRASMNMVAERSKVIGLMDHTGDECVPMSVSLLHAYVADPPRVAVLQRYDGYGPTLELSPLEEADTAASVDNIASLVATVPILTLLSPDEVTVLARQVRPILLGPIERLVRDGDEGTSLFIVAAGNVEVLRRLEDGSDVLISKLGPGSIVGEMALLTGQRRSGTVRAADDGALVFEIAEQHYRSLISAHPEWVDELTSLMEERLRQQDDLLASRGSVVSIRDRIRAKFFANSA
jgi:CRP-like cAMP-binding protein